jgi:hypothetical protein
MNCTEKEAELIGALMGDGFIYIKEKHYRIGFTGNPQTDVEYYNYILKLIYAVIGKKARAIHRSRGLRIVINSKEYVTRLTKEFALPFGKNKDRRVFIPMKLANDWNLTKYVIRGLIDTDGSVFTSDKRGSLDYPTLEFNTTSKVLVEQIKGILDSRGFYTTKVWSYRSRVSTTPLYKIALNGRKNLNKWLIEIGFSNPHKRAIALNATLKVTKRVST